MQLSRSNGVAPTNDLHIAGWNTADDWKDLRAKLLGRDTEELWTSAYKDYYRQRLELRYLGPIKALRESGSYQGEGFSIVAIQCTLFEFLQSTIDGTNYRFLKKGDKLGPYEYSSSKDVFVAFLTKNEPFSKIFNEDTAFDFYIGVRCGLLHEARTKNDWTISAKSHNSLIADTQRKIVYRDNFQDAILLFIEDYGVRLVKDKELQAAFIRKFDKLCE